MTERPKEYWRWTESRWTSPDLDWRDGAVISAGVDVGSVQRAAQTLEHELVGLVAREQSERERGPRLLDRFVAVAE